MFHSTTCRPQPHRYIYLAEPDNLARRTDASAAREYSSRVGFSGKGSIGVLSRKGEKSSEFTPNCKRLNEPVFVEYQHSTELGDLQITRIRLSEDFPLNYLVKSFNRSQVVEYLAGLRERAKLARAIEREVRSELGGRVASGLTMRGKRVIADGIALLEHKYGVRSLGFYTLTCPYSEREDIQVFNDNYSMICKRYLEWVKRRYESVGAKFSYVGVHEIQPSRLRRTGDECLHLHYVAPAFNPSGGFVLLHSEMVAKYREIVERFCEKALNLNPRVDAALVKRSAGGYLAKYYSKGRVLDASEDRQGAVARLSSWYTVSRSILLAVKRSTVELPGSIADELFRCSATGEGHEYTSYLSPVYVEIEGKRFHCGCSFELTGEFLLTLRELKYLDVCNLY